MAGAALRSICPPPARSRSGWPARAERQTRSLLEQRGRRDLADGYPRRAALSLAEALRRDPDSRPLRTRLSEALQADRAYVGKLVGHEKIVYDRALSPDGSQVATASYDNTVRQWSAETGAPIDPVIRFDLRPVVVAFDPVAPRLATGSRPGTRLVTSPWLLDDGRLVPKPR